MAGALDGIRILDFTWVLAGPATTRYFADYGAEVIKIESHVHPDFIRTTPPYNEGKPGLNRSAYWANYNGNKYGMSIDLDHPKGIELVKRLVPHVDIVAENFKPGTMAKWGLGYEDFAKLNPDIIMASLSLFGQTGPFSNRFGVGTFAEGMSGILNLIGWPDRIPSFFLQIIGDGLLPFFSVSALVAALEHRDETGEGQWLDLNQLDVCAYIMGPLLLDWATNGREPTRCGNRSAGSAPHAVYPCAGEDKWCAISVLLDEEWDNLRAAMGDPDWARDTKFATFASRKANEEELDRLMGSWTAGFSPDDLMNRLQAAGVPAGAVLTGKGIYCDPQLTHRGVVSYAEHPEFGRLGYYGTPYKLSATPSELRMPAPSLGEHTERICSQILKMSNEEFVQLVNEGVLV
ncbi:MAG: CoA transferase [Chloroflexi bacterium]|nr:CoA transferase [Chloroflexota bacterium]